MRAAAALAPAPAPYASSPWTLGAANDAAEVDAEWVAARVLSGLTAAPQRLADPGVLRRDDGGAGRDIALPTAGDVEQEAAEALADAAERLARGEQLADAYLAELVALVDQAVAAIGSELARAADAAAMLLWQAVLVVARAIIQALAFTVVTDASALLALIRLVEAGIDRVASLPEDLAALGREAGRVVTGAGASVADAVDRVLAAGGVREEATESRRETADRIAERERAAEELGILPPIGSICGPDVTTQTSEVWGRVQRGFRPLPPDQKCAACTRLVNPVIVGSGAISPSTVGAGLRHIAETGNVVMGGQAVLMGLGLNLNRDAFDTLGLFLGSAAYLRDPPFSPACGQPPTPDPAASLGDRVHETPTTCATTVQIGNECWVSGTANYGTYGIMMRECHDWLAGSGDLGNCLLPPAVFSRDATTLMVQAYKRLDRDDPEPPTRWAVATYDGGATAYASGGNRPNCPTTCAVPYGGGPFGYVWEPVVPRAGWTP
ncbi:hypothetical protein [Elioraea sp.]|uniref:hypothetical protein n=1 Tax=Elioraea sp. TaxID=2185103 RepID=UPI0025C3B357|nr:hypothetical protein [Elioraea sp.]